MVLPTCWKCGAIRRGYRVIMNGVKMGGLHNRDHAEEMVKIYDIGSESPRHRLPMGNIFSIICQGLKQQTSDPESHLILTDAQIPIPALRLESSMPEELSQPFPD